MKILCFLPLLFLVQDWPEFRGPTGQGLSDQTGLPLTPSPLLVGEELYLVSDTGIATCLDFAHGKGILAAANRGEPFRFAGFRRRPDLLSQ